MANTFEQKYPNTTRTISGLVNVPFQDDVVLLCDTSAGAVGVQLLAPAVGKWSTQYKLYIIDKSNNASVNNITVTAPVGVLINGQSSFVISSNNASLLVRIGSDTNYVGQYSVTAGGGGVSGHIICDEGVPLPQRLKLNFVGGSVTATDDAMNNQTIVTITGGASIIDITNAGLLALIGAGTVVVGQFYRVTDVLNADEGVVVQGIRANGTTTVNGAGVFLNADYQANGNYSGVAGFVSALGLWSSVPTVVAVGNTVVYGNRNYVNLTGAWGTAPDTDVVNWQVLPKSDTTGYKREIDFVTYNVVQNKVITRVDARGNEVDEYVDGSGQSSIALFQWGKSNVINNKVKSNSIMYCTNSYARFDGNILTGGGILQDNTNKLEFGYINYNIIEDFGKITLENTRGRVEYNRVCNPKSVINTIAGGLNLVDVSATIRYNTIFSGSQIEVQLMNGSSAIEENFLIQSSIVHLGTLQNTEISRNTFTNQGELQVATGAPLSKIVGCEVSDGCVVPIVNLNSVITNKKAKIGYSNWEYELNMADPTIYDVPTKTLTIPVQAQNYAGLYTLVNSIPPPLIIEKIANHPLKFKAQFRPANTETVVFRHTLIGVAVADSLLCDAPASSNLLTGRTNGCDFIEYEVTGNMRIRTNLVIVA